MKPLHRIILFILICWFGYNAFRQTLSPQTTGVTGGFEYLYLVVLVILFLVAIVSDFSAYRTYPKSFQFYSTVVALFLCAVVFLQLIKFSRIGSSKTIFTVRTKEGSPHVLFIQFKEKDYLRMEELNRTGSDIYYGKYYKNKDSIIITQTNYDKLSGSLPVAGIIQNNMFILNNYDTFLIEDSKN